MGVFLILRIFMIYRLTSKVHHMKSITIHPQSKEQIRLFEQLAKALHLPFEKKEEKSPYDPEFVAQLKKEERRGYYTEIEAERIKTAIADSRDEIKQGRTKTHETVMQEAKVRYGL